VKFAKFSTDGNLLIVGVDEPACIQFWTLDGKLLLNFYLHATPNHLHILNDSTFRILTATAHGDDYVDLSYSANPTPPVSWRSLILPSYITILAGTAAENSGKGHFSVRSMCQNILGLEETHPFYSCDTHIFEFFRQFYRYTTIDAKPRPQIQKAQIFPIFEPVYQSVKNISKKRQQVSLEDMVALVEKGKKEAESLLHGLGFLEWEEEYQ